MHPVFCVDTPFHLELGGLHWAAGLTPILEMIVPSAMH